MLHFRLKSDKKPYGTRISPIQHFDYIRREGNSAEDTNFSLDKQKSESDELCKQPESIEQIQLIAAGILRKNRNLLASCKQ